MIPSFLRPEVILYASLERLTPPRPIVCAWCDAYDRADPANVGASHGMCPSCCVRVEAAAIAEVERTIEEAQRGVVSVRLVPLAPDAPLAPVVDVALVPYTCFVDDLLQRDEGRSMALCGQWVDECDIRRDPTCPDCRRRLEADSPSIR